MDIVDGVLISIEDNDIDENGHFKVPKDVHTIGGNVFKYNQKLISIDIHEGVNKIENRAFSNCKNLKSAIIYEGIKKIGEYAFSFCSSLEKTSIPPSLEIIEQGAFYGCNKLKYVIIHEGVQKTGKYSFRFCSPLEMIAIPSSVKIIGESAFENCNLKSAIIHEGVKEIGECAFYCCQSLETITIPESIEIVGETAFNLCDKLTQIRITVKNKEEFNRVKALLPQHLQDKTVMVICDYDKLLKIQHKALEKLYRAPSTNPVLTLAKNNAENSDVIQEVPVEIWGKVNRYLGKQVRYYNQALASMNQITPPSTDNDDSLKEYRLKCDEIVDVYVLKSNDLIKKVNFGFFKKHANGKDEIDIIPEPLSAGIGSLVGSGTQ